MPSSVIIPSVDEGRLSIDGTVPPWVEKGNAVFRIENSKQFRPSLPDAWFGCFIGRGSYCFCVEKLLRTFSGKG